MTPSIETIRSCLREMAAARGASKTFCPSEVARSLAEDGWRDLMPAVREVAAELVEDGELRCTQRGSEVDPVKAHGPLRLQLTVQTTPRD